MKRSTLIATVASVLLVVAGNAQTTVSGTIDGHDYVDLGLSVKWATCNVGASSPEDYGDYFAWGETSPKSTYTDENYTAHDYLGDISGNSNYDAARANWGGSWRMPIDAEIKELVDKCTWTTKDGYYGFTVTSKINGNSIFLPAAGWRFKSSLNDAGEFGYYWSAWPNGYDIRYASVLFFFRDCTETFSGRAHGLSVRPVSD